MLDCVSGWVRAADPCSVKAHQRGSRGGTAAELRRARDELAQAEAGRRSLRREFDAMIGRVAQLTAQLCENGGRGQLGKRRRDDYAASRDDDYDRSRGRDLYGPARGRAERQEGRYGDRYYLFFFESKHFIYSFRNVHNGETEQHYLNIVM